MEAFLLTLDVICLVLLCFSVRRVSKTQNPKDLGFFAYLAHRHEEQPEAKRR
jgi:hypothetical protein